MASLKDVGCWGSSREEIKRFPKDIQHDIGFQLYRLQQGLEPNDFKYLTGVESGIYEIRLADGDAYRVFYVTKFEDAIWVLHASRKKTRRTSEADITIIRSRFRELARFQREQSRTSTLKKDESRGKKKRSKQ